MSTNARYENQSLRDAYVAKVNAALDAGLDGLALELSKAYVDDAAESARVVGFPLPPDEPTTPSTPPRAA